ncbi:MAG: hypothetical protein ACTSRZ_10410 [Promethearchaeota archaeon]
MSNADEIIKKLGNKITKSELLAKISEMKVKDLDISRVINDTNDFLDGFSFYLNDNEFKEHILKIITISYEICEDLNDLKSLFLKTMIVRLIEIYLNYAKINESAKETVLDVLGKSFGKLDPKAQILNVCLLVDPIFKSKDYIADKAKLEEKEVEYKEIPEISDIEKQIKAEVDNWIQKKHIDLAKQNELFSELRNFCKSIAQTKGIDISTEEYQQLEDKCVEMLRMQITSIALLSELEEEDLNPIPIN